MKPDIRYTDRDHSGYLPSWSQTRSFVNDTHNRIFELTKDIPGWQAEGDSLKLFEMGYYCGDVILEIGVFGGRSATVSILGALSNTARQGRVQYYGVDVDPQALVRATDTLQRFKIDRHAILFNGAIADFTAAIDITPTMVFVDGDHTYEGTTNDLRALTEILVEGTPVFCHDYRNPENETGEYGVDRACHEWEKAGYADFAGTFGCSALYITTAKCHGFSGSLASGKFAKYKQVLNERYGLR